MPVLRIVAIGLDQIDVSHLERGLNVGAQARDDLLLARFGVQTVHETQVWHVPFFGLVENMSSESIRVHDGRRLLHAHEEASEILVLVGRLGENDLKWLKLARKLLRALNVVLFRSLEMP